MSTCGVEFEKWFTGRYPREAEFTSVLEYQSFKDDAREIWTAAWTRGWDASTVAEQAAMAARVKACLEIED